MTRVWLFIIAALILISAALTWDNARLTKRARRAEDALLLANQGKAELAAQLKASEAGLEALRQERDGLSSRLREAGLEANRIRRDGEARVQRLLLEPVPSDPSSLVTWAAGQAQDLNRRLEAP